MPYGIRPELQTRNEIAAVLWYWTDLIYSVVTHVWVDTAMTSTSERVRSAGAALSLRLMPIRLAGGSNARTVLTKKRTRLLRRPPDGLGRDL